MIQVKECVALQDHKIVRVVRRSSVPFVWCKGDVRPMPRAFQFRFRGRMFFRCVQRNINFNDYFLFAILQNNVRHVLYRRQQEGRHDGWPGYGISVLRGTLGSVFQTRV